MERSVSDLGTFIKSRAEPAQVLRLPLGSKEKVSFLVDGDSLASFFWLQLEDPSLSGCADALSFVLTKLYRFINMAQCYLPSFSHYGVELLVIFSGMKYCMCSLEVC